MFVGHLALGLAAKRAAPAASLGWLLGAVLALDLLWPFFLFAGLEQVTIQPGATAFTPLVFDHYPWTHSLVMAVVWGLVLAGLARWRRVRASALLLVPLVVSHWLLDFVSHAPDLPLWPGTSPRLGLGLWNSVPATFVVEGALWALGLGLYLQGRREWAMRERIAFWSLVGICTVMWATTPFGPPPPSVQGLAGFALIAWLIPPWAALAERRDKP
jgi:hypothetical protein